jgi:predicted nucleic acid-binding protein
MGEFGYTRRKIPSQAAETDPLLTHGKVPPPRVPFRDASRCSAEHPVGDEVVSLSQRLNPHRLRPLDAIHVASAMLLDADLLITYDDRMSDAGQHNGLRCAAPGR